MAWTKVNTYMSIILLVLSIFVTMGIVGTDIINEDRITINEKSIDYILELKGLNDESGYINVSDTNSADSQEKEILDSEDDKLVSENNDFLSTLYIKKERASEPTNLIKLIYNMPTSMLTGLGLPLADFTHIINIFSYFLFVAVLITIWLKLIRT